MSPAAAAAVGMKSWLTSHSPGLPQSTYMWVTALSPFPRIVLGQMHSILPENISPCDDLWHAVFPLTIQKQRTLGVPKSEELIISIRGSIEL